MSDWWRGAVMYQIYPRSFQDFERRRDRRPAGHHRAARPTSPTSGSTRSGCRRSSPRRWPTWATTSRTTPTSTRSSARSPTSTRMVARAHALGLKVIIDQVLSHSSDQHPFFSESRSSRDNPKADWYVWADPKHDGTPPNNWLSVFGGPRLGLGRAAAAVLPAQLPGRAARLQLPQPGGAGRGCSSTMRFWLERGVDGFRLDTVNFYFHDALLRDDPADFRSEDAAGGQPLRDAVPHLLEEPAGEPRVPRARCARCSTSTRRAPWSARWARAITPIRMMGEYTTGKRLHKAYSLRDAGRPLRSRAFPRADRGVLSPARRAAGRPGRSRTTTCRGTSPAGRSTGSARSRSPSWPAALLLSLEGSVCIYQGEELGQTETELEFDELTDPQGIRFWPEYKGRDGCRTPMVWDGGDAASGFSTGRPWLPVKAPQAARHVAGQTGGPGLGARVLPRDAAPAARHRGAADRAARGSSTSRSRCWPSPAAGRCSASSTCRRSSTRCS